MSRKIISIGMMVVTALLGSACQSKKSGAGVEELDSIQPKKELTTIFGEIPGIYEKEMRVITDKARESVTDGDHHVIRRMMADLADSAYQVAEMKATPYAVEMIGATLKHSSEDSLGYQLVSEIEVICAFLPQLQQTEGNERVAVQFNVNKDWLPLEAYYALVGSEGEIAVGQMAFPAQKGNVQVLAYIVAPNIPSKYLKLCSELHFISKKTYQDLKPQVEKRQQKWREAYWKEIGLF